MRIVPQYTPRAMPKTHVSIEDRYSIKKNKDGTKELVKEEVESKGGVMFTFPAGHSIRLATIEQIEQFRLTTKPRLVDIDTGEEVNELGVPVSLAQFVANGGMSGGDFGTDVADALENE